MGIFRQAYMNDTDEMMPYFYWLSVTGVIGIKTYTKMQSYFGSPRELYNASMDKINDTGIFTARQKKAILDTRNSRDVLKEYERMQERGIKMFVRESQDFPERLKEIPGSPIALFVYGNLPAQGIPLVSVIGARECSFYGMQVASRLGELFAEHGICVVSGMARGIDSISQDACLKAGGTSIAVLGGGVDVVYPKESEHLYNVLKEKGAIISEYPPGTDPIPAYFASRNRIISGISDALCVIEAREKSGTMITVDAALEQGREVYALPGRITDSTSKGCNELIKQGAGVISDPEKLVMEIKRDYSLFTDAAPGDNYTFNIEETRTDYETDILIEDMDESDKKVIISVGEDSFTAEELSQKVSVHPGEFLIKCMNLSVKGLLINMGAGRFRLSDKGFSVRSKLLKI